MSRRAALIIGAGALGLGFLVERLVADYDICLADVSSREAILRRVVAEDGFTVNVCGAGTLQSRRVAGRFVAVVTDTPEGRVALSDALSSADLVLTATNRGVLDTVIDTIAPALNARKRSAWLLFCENGLHIARSYRPRFCPHVVLVDTVMSRMCRLGDTQMGKYQPLWVDHGARLVVEDFDHVPLDSDLCSAGPFSSVFSMVSRSEFLLWEDVKLYMHNGMHAFIAYRAHLAGVERFVDTPGWIRDEALDVMLNEVIPAVVRTHACADREQIERYGLNLLERFCNPFFDDTIERGVRGVAAKLAPEERLVGGCEYIRCAGIEPRGYAGTVQVAIEILARQQITREET